MTEFYDRHVIAWVMSRRDADAIEKDQYLIALGGGDPDSRRRIQHRAMIKGSSRVKAGRLTFRFHASERLEGCGYADIFGTAIEEV